MYKYECRFIGRKVGAIGITYWITHTVYAEYQDQALSKCYDVFEHISQFSAVRMDT